MERNEIVDGIVNLLDGKSVEDSTEILRLARRVIECYQHVDSADILKRCNESLVKQDEIALCSSKAV